MQLPGAGQAGRSGGADGRCDGSLEVVGGGLACMNNCTSAWRCCWVAPIWWAADTTARTEGMSIAEGGLRRLR